MAHFAQLDENNIVTQVIVVRNEELHTYKNSSLDENNNVIVNSIESESEGIIFCKGLFGEDTKWVQTSYNNNYRGKFAALGDTFDEETQTFISPDIEQSEE